MPDFVFCKFDEVMEKKRRSLAVHKHFPIVSLCEVLVAKANRDLIKPA